MLIGLLHLHRTLGYLVFLLALVSVVLVTWSGRTDPRTAAMISGVVRYGIRYCGGLTILLGVLVWAYGPWPLQTGWLWLSLLLWGPVEVFAARFILPETALVVDGGQGTARMVVGAVGQLLCIATIFGLMSARP